MDSMFNNFGRIGYDQTDNTQRNVQNTRFANYSLSNYFSDNLTDDTVRFACAQPTMMVSGTAQGKGLNRNVVDYESILNIKTEQERPLDKLSLNQRLFVTVPYLGKGAVDPDLESKMLQGEAVYEKKSVGTIMEKSFMSYTMQPVSKELESRVQDPKNFVEESAMDGWVRGGINSREMAEDSAFHRPTW